MSDVEQRQTQQRAFSVAACAAVFAVGGPIIGEHAEVQRVYEDQATDQVKLTAMLEAEQQRLTAASLKLRQQVGEDSPWLSRVSFNFDLDAPAIADFDGAAFFDRLGAFDPSDLKSARKARSEIDCLAEAIYYEARSESERGQYAVAEVVMNRVADRHFPDTICGVVFEGHYRETGCQFTFTCDGSRREEPRGEAWDRARAIAMNVRLGFYKPQTRKATHYHTDYVDPYWSDSLVKTTVIGTHIFYRWPKTSAERAHANAAMAARRAHEATLVALEDSTELPAGVEVAEPAVYSQPETAAESEETSKEL